MKLTEQQLNNKEDIVKDKSLSMEERKDAWKDLRNNLLNPRENFNPDTFDPYDAEENYDVMKRARVTPPKELPTFGLKPKEIMEGQMIGMYESKGDLYLTFAHRTNALQTEVDSLNKRIKQLEGKK